MYGTLSESHESEAQRVIREERPRLSQTFIRTHFDMTGVDQARKSKTLVIALVLLLQSQWGTWINILKEELEETKMLGGGGGGGGGGRLPRHEPEQEDVDSGQNIRAPGNASSQVAKEEGRNGSL